MPAATIEAVAREIGAAGSAFATHVWRNAAAGNLGGWQVARCLELLVVLVGAVGTPGGTNLNTQDKFVPPPFLKPGPQKVWKGKGPSLRSRSQEVASMMPKTFEPSQP